MNTELNWFLQTLIEDTKNNSIFWNNVYDWNESYTSLDIRGINLSLSAITTQNPFKYDNWRDVYVADILNGYVFIVKVTNTPPLYRLYIQTDAHDKLNRVAIKSDMLLELFQLAKQQVNTSDDKLYNFVERYLQTHFIDHDDEDND